MQIVNIMLSLWKPFFLYNDLTSQLDEIFFVHLRVCKHVRWKNIIGTKFKFRWDAIEIEKRSKENSSVVSFYSHNIKYSQQEVNIINGDQCQRISLINLKNFSVSRVNDNIENGFERQKARNR